MRTLILILAGLISQTAGATATNRLGGLTVPAINSYNWGTVLNQDIYQTSSNTASQLDPNTFTGSSNTFTTPVQMSSASVGILNVPSSATITNANVSSATITNLNVVSATMAWAQIQAGPEWVMRSSDDFSGGIATATINISNLAYPWETSVASISWKMDWSCWLASATYPQLVVNTDNGAKYSYSVGGFNTSNSIASNGSATGNCLDLDGTQNPQLGSSPFGTVNFEVGYGSQTVLTNFWWDGRSGYPGQADRRTFGAGRYTGSAIINQLNFVEGTGLCSVGISNHVGPVRCHIEVWRKGFQHQ